MKRRPTQAKASVTLTLAQWNTVFCAFSDAVRYNREHNWHAVAGETQGLHDTIEAQIGARVNAAFDKEFPVEDRREND